MPAEWLSIFALREVSLAWGAPGSDAEDVFFDSLCGVVQTLHQAKSPPEGIVVFTGPGRLSLVRGAVALALGLGQGWNVPVRGVSLRDLLQAGWPVGSAMPSFHLLAEPVRRWPLVFHRGVSGRVSRRMYETHPPASLWKNRALVVEPGAHAHVPQGHTTLPWPGHPAASVLKWLPQLPQKTGNAAHSLEYAREAL